MKLADAHAIFLNFYMGSVPQLLAFQDSWLHSLTDPPLNSSLCCHLLFLDRSLMSQAEQSSSPHSPSEDSLGAHISSFSDTCLFPRCSSQFRCSGTQGGGAPSCGPSTLLGAPGQWLYQERASPGSYMWSSQSSLGVSSPHWLSLPWNISLAFWKAPSQCWFILSRFILHEFMVSQLFPNHLFMSPITNKAQKQKTQWRTFMTITFTFVSYTLFLPV